MEHGLGLTARGPTLPGSRAQAGGMGKANGMGGGWGMGHPPLPGRGGRYTPYLLTHWEEAFVRLRGLVA